MQDKAEAGADVPPPAELAHAGAVIDKAVEYMMSQNISSLAIASALLGGALALLARSLSDEAIIAILDNAIDSVTAGDLREMAAADEATEPGSLAGGAA